MLKHLSIKMYPLDRIYIPENRLIFIYTDIIKPRSYVVKVWKGKKYLI